MWLVLRCQMKRKASIVTTLLQMQVFSSDVFLQSMCCWLSFLYKDFFLHMMLCALVIISVHKIILTTDDMCVGYYFCLQASSYNPFYLPIRKYRWTVHHLYPYVRWLSFLYTSFYPVYNQPVPIQIVLCVMKPHY